MACSSLESGFAAVAGDSLRRGTCYDFAAVCQLGLRRTLASVAKEQASAVIDSFSHPLKAPQDQ